MEHLEPLVELYGNHTYLVKIFFSNVVSEDRQSNTWSVRLGQLLLSAKKQDAKTFYEKLKLVRKEQVVPLSAASYECGTYQRGYEYIVRSVCVF